MITTTLVWKDRLVKMLDKTTWAMSRVGAHGDFDYFGEPFGRRSPVAGNFMLPGCAEPFEVTDIKVLDENRLYFCTTGGAYILIGNPMDEGRIEKVEDEVAPDHIVSGEQ